ncbi:hypothetical protein [Pseudonocardia acaciae]|uniref:hypothetical protein n=1 Tax=Pseudonocardia acaciae TaxID=551276 RepID=UPI000684C55F|nr:hypothetical protein [Pseudonocardia acaciae]
MRAACALLALAAVLGVTAACMRVVPPDPPVPTASQPLLPVSHWRGLFDAEAAANDPESDRLSRSRDSFDFYTLAYSIDELASMYEATGDVGYARKALRFTRNMIASARPSASLPTSSFKDSYQGWVSASNSDDETPLYESYAWRYVTRLLRLLKPGIGTAPGDVRADYGRALAFTETNIVDKWRARGPNEHIYRSHTHMAAHWASIALDVSLLTADPARRAACTEIVRNIDDHLPNYPSSLRKQLQPGRTDPRAYWWSDEWGVTGGPGQDVGHGNGVIAYVVEARDTNAGWSPEELARFARTLTGLISGPRYPEFVDGTGSDNGWIADGFVKLGRYDPGLQATLQSYGVQNSQFYASMAVNAARLGARG